MIRQRTTVKIPVKSGHNYGLGSIVTVLAEVTIGDNRVICADPVVNKGTPARGVTVGVLAIVISSSLGSTYE